MTDQKPAKRLKTGGRTAGTPNKVSGLLRDAILEAAAACGADGKGKDGLVGYLTKQARRNQASFNVLLGKVMPTQVTGAEGGPLEYRDVTDAKDKLAHFLSRQVAAGLATAGAGSA